MIYLDKDRGSSVGRYKVVKDLYQREGVTGSFEIKPEGGTSVLISAAAKPDVANEFLKENPEATRAQVRDYLKTQQLSNTGTDEAEKKQRQRMLLRHFPQGQTSPT